MLNTRLPLFFAQLFEDFLCLWINFRVPLNNKSFGVIAVIRSLLMLPDGFQKLLLRYRLILGFIISLSDLTRNGGSLIEIIFADDLDLRCVTVYWTTNIRVIVQMQLFWHETFLHVVRGISLV
jgi:hypothetical protein